MNQYINKYKNGIYLIFSLLVFFWIATVYSFIHRYSYTNLSISLIILLIFILVFIIIYLVLFIKFINGVNKQQLKDVPQQKEQLTDNNKDTGIISNNEKETEKNQFGAILFNGITKKTSKEQITKKILTNLINNQNAGVGLYYTYNSKSKTYQITANYAYFSAEQPPDFKEGEGLIGQVVRNKKAMFINNISDKTLTILSGLGKGQPQHLFIYPIVEKNKTTGIIEIASFSKFSDKLEEDLNMFFQEYSDKINRKENK